VTQIESLAGGIRLEPKQDPKIYLPAFGLWLASAALSIVMFLSGRALIIRTYARFFPLDAYRVQFGSGSLSLVNILISMPLAIVVIAIMIGGFEYQYRKMGEPEAWRLLSTTLAVELGIIFLASFI